MSRMKDMTVGNPLWQILTFSAPLFAMNLLYLSYAVVNTYVAGNTLGPAALAAIGSAMGGLHYCVFGFFSGMTSGFTVVTGQRFGAKDMANVRRSIGTSFILCACISLPLLILAGVGAKAALQLLRTPQEVIGNATMYLRILFFFSFLNIMHLLLNSILRALGDSKTPLYFSIYGTLANIGMNLLLVLYFELGVAGVAWATIFSQSTAAIFCAAYALWKMPILRLKKEDLRMDWRFSWEHLRIALPMALQFSVTSVGMVVLQWAVNDFGKDALGGISATGPLGTLTIAPLFSIGVGIATYAAQNYGARNLERIREGVRKTAFVVFCFTLATSILMYIFAEPLVDIFVKDDDPNAPIVLAYGTQYLRLQATFYVILGQLLIFRNVQQGMGYASAPFWAGVAELVARVVGAFVLAQLFGFTGAALSHPLAWIGATVVVFADYVFTIRKLKKTGIPERIKTGKKTA